MAKSEKELPFEEAMTALEEAVSKMEEGNVPLEEMIRQYEEARKLALYCQKKLTGMKEKIEILTKDTAEGGEWRDMTPEESQPKADDFFRGE